MILQFSFLCSWMELGLQCVLIFKKWWRLQSFTLRALKLKVLSSWNPLLLTPHFHAEEFSLLTIFTNGTIYLEKCNSKLKLAKTELNGRLNSTGSHFLPLTNILQKAKKFKSRLRKSNVKVNWKRTWTHSSRKTSMKTKIQLSLCSSLQVKVGICSLWKN